MKTIGLKSVEVFTIIQIALQMSSFFASITSEICGPDEFQCKTLKKCIELEKRCDGFKHCWDGSDEDSCESCVPGLFQCNITKDCISFNLRCDGNHDCLGNDTSDEENCESCTTDAFYCNTTQSCVINTKRCDGYFDCGESDTSDEENCETCQMFTFHCEKSQKCIPIKQKCDGENHCGNDDASDEQNCVSKQEESCLANEFQCQYSRNCVSASSLCDGRKNCGYYDFSDEENCEICKNNAFLCRRSKQCIPSEYRCDGSMDCAYWDGSDEKSCESCLNNAIYCNITKQCIGYQYRCDGIYHCGEEDLSDELNCNKCEVNSFRCNNGQCISIRITCNGKNDCIDGSDELNCLTTDECLLPNFRCINGKCISNNYICNGDNDCGDLSDELYCSDIYCSGLWCNVSSKCISISKHCNLHHDCDDESDEINCTASFAILAGNSSITAELNGFAEWKRNLRSNREFTLKFKTPSGHIVDFNTKKYSIHFAQKDQFLYEMVLEIHNIVWEDEGFYQLEASIADNDFKPTVTNLYLTVEDLTLPEMKYTNLKNSTLSIILGTTIDLICNVTDRPGTKVTWFWDDRSMIDWPSNIKYTMYQGDQILQLQNVKMDAKGRYKCTVKNSNGEITRFADIDVTTTVAVVVIASGIAGSLLGLFILVVVSLLVRYKWNQRKLRRILNEISKTEEIDLLFDHSKWQIQRKHLELGETLGSGTFGVVVKARVLNETEFSTVAVKMVKENADISHFKSLISELKILSTLGKHPNIVNLIGACTHNLATKKDFLVAMEYCHHGSILNYLHDNRKTFINQLDPVSGKINPIICSKKRSKMLPKSIEFSTDLGKRHSNFESETCTYDYQIHEQTPLRTTDLLIWATQISEGMEYLASLNVLHGDLAARNILLTETFMAKLCDFGYAREIAENVDYHKDIQGVLLPIKWMAIESITNGTFSTKSDCWSFGVVLWELFSIGESPYPELDFQENFLERLKQGYRMDKPEYTPTEIYCIMKDCWLHEPSERPSFKVLCEKLETILIELEAVRTCEMDKMYTHLVEDVA